MAQQTINNSESGLSVRNKLNANFTELYTGKDSVTVNAFADLPDPTTVPQQKYWVLTSTGIYLINRRNKGAYYSDGAVWTWLGDNPTTADQIGNVPSGSVTATDVQGAIDQLAAGGGGLSGEATITITRLGGAFEWTEVVTATGVTASNKIMLGLAAATDDDENCAELLDISALEAVPSTDAITITVSFPVPVSGPIKFNWSAV